MARFPKVAEPSLSRGARRKHLHFDEVHQLHKENQILMITVQTSSGRVSHKKKKKKISLPLFSIFFFFLSCFKLAYAWKACSQENFNLLMFLAPTVDSGLLCECNG